MDFILGEALGIGRRKVVGGNVTKAGGRKGEKRRKRSGILSLGAAFPNLFGTKDHCSYENLMLMISSGAEAVMLPLGNGFKYR